MTDNFSIEKVNALEATLGLREKSPLELFYEKPCEVTLREISKRNQTPEMVLLAVEHDGYALKSISKKLITVELCEIALKQNGQAISYIPETILEQNPHLYTIAVESDGAAIQYVPKNILSPKLALQAVSQQLRLKHDFQKYPIHFIPKHLLNAELVRISILNSPNSIRDIPECYLSKELYQLAVSRNGVLLKFVPPKLKDKEMIAAAIKSNPRAIEFIPPSKRTKRLCKLTYEANPYTIKWIPEKYITLEMCLNVIDKLNVEDIKKISRNERLPNPFIGWFPEKFRNNKSLIDSLTNKIGFNGILNWHYALQKKIEEYGEFGELMIPIRPLLKDTVDYLLSKQKADQIHSIPQIVAVGTETPLPSNQADLITVNDNEVHTYDLAITEDSSLHSVYYVTDIHLEHQLINSLSKDQLNYEGINTFLNNKIDELVSSAKDTQGYLLIGGDVGHTKDLVTRFYKKLLCKWNGTIISILGNHELWDDHPEALKDGHISRSLGEIISEYRSRINYQSWNRQAVMLQNEVYIKYKNRKDTVIPEKQLLNANDDDLRDLLSKSTFILLGGIGFSGHNQVFNATTGLYRSAVPTLDEDILLTNQFRKIYDKVNRCAGHMQVIVFTHTPVYDWLSEPCNPNWIYINGHTHQNALIRKKDGTTVLSDNQVGYKPSKWKLNAFTVAGWYDPLKDFEDGIHEISSEVYKDFNLGRGIQSNGCKYDGTIYALKKNGYYMFLLRSTSSLCLLAGGHRTRLANSDVKYYYDKMDQYALKVKKAVLPYQQAIKALATEVEQIGGWGRVHGCIVDIDWFNHIFLNPFDGKVTPYFAYSTSSRITYPDLSSLLKDRLPYFYRKFLTAQKQSTIPLLNQYAVSKKNKKGTKALATVPQLVLGTDMYKPSNIMKSIQYIFEDNTIRIWKDDILSADFEDTLSPLPIEDKHNE